MPLSRGVADEVPDDEEVAREVHALDDLELVARAARGRPPARSADRGCRGVRAPRAAAASPSRATLVEVAVERLARRAPGSPAGGSSSVPRSSRQRSAIASVLSIAAPSSGKSRSISSADLEVELLRGVLQAIGIGQGALGADAEQDVVGEGVVLAQVVAVVGRHQAEARACATGGAAPRWPPAARGCRGPAARGRSSPAPKISRVVARRLLGFGLAPRRGSAR